jgi:hypothetical protein
MWHPLAPHPYQLGWPVTFDHTARRANDDDKLALIKKVDCFIFDCDGKMQKQGYLI